ncbi:MAG TPA: sigma-54 dependent transcriptional regulator [Vicinamibacterales bacterium]|jgi:DNA-binding NtrC family response regulator|nr:sigma-54 dependent transcriptional regulator [Vicinamibacterales bacterium]
MTKPYVAIVDDDSSFAQYLRTFLSLRGYEVRCYTRGDEVLASMKQNEAPDVVLLDVMMPGLDGLATLRALKTSRPETQVIMLSGRNQASTIVEAVRLGAADYVVKPDDPEGLGEIALDVAIKNAIEKNRLVIELSELRQQLSDDEDLTVWGNSEKMRGVATVIEQVADSDVTVLIRGESGVGKELVSRAIHQRSPRRQRPFVKVNCAALPAELLESELFGHERGAFTGAATTRIGKFEQADTGTLLLDEIGEMKPALQAKLLHVLQDAEFTKLGSNKRINVDVRVVTATNRDLEKMMLSGEFREDLYYRIKVIEITVPALRERCDEVPTLTDFFLARYARKYNRPLRAISEELRRLFQEYEWPGNIRELENMTKRIIILQDEQLVVREIQRNMQRAAANAVVAAPVQYAVAGVGGPVSTAPIAIAPPVSMPEPEPTEAEEPGTPAYEGSGSLASVAKAASIKAERAAIEQTLRQVHWNRRKAAQILGVSYKTLLNKIKECQITRA